MPADIVIPSSLPRPLAGQHVYDGIDAAETVPKDQGELRRLPRYPSVPRRLALAWRFNQEQFDTFWDWYEDTLAAGARRFDVFVGRLGEAITPGIAPGTWRTAQFIEVPQYEPSAGRYLVRARVLCIGAPFDTRTAPGLLASGVDDDSGGAVFASSGLLASGTDDDSGGARFRYGDVLAGGEDTDDGGAFMGEPAGADQALAALWFGIELDETASDAQDAQAAAFADFGP